jgi:hypothetical protein
MNLVYDIYDKNPIKPKAVCVYEDLIVKKKGKIEIKNIFCFPDTN